ncbi:MAG: 1-deoxy-D-xylulose-5-phosphate reductoisomerase [Deltaproteobacteria bacterium]|nr:1-deoxy-D-xylulose-5-phosphate reductoisomerase [Deltaproteobacteria bacterium]
MTSTLKTRLAILGSTGSIGQQTLDVVRRNPERFEVVALTASSQVALLAEQVAEFRPEVVAMRDDTAAQQLRTSISTTTRVVSGDDAAAHCCALDSVDCVVAGIVGSAALEPVITAIRGGKSIALANKECLVAGGDLLRRELSVSSSRIVPVDSEHSSIYQCLAGRGQADVRKIYLTASGGPFWKLSAAEMANVTPEMAVKHPRWAMGAKISVDSATLMNKGLEMIEACWLFDMSPDQVGIFVHPQSLVHGLVEFSDASLIACLFEPDMRMPISYALGELARDGLGARVTQNGVSALDLVTKGKLEFFAPDFERFPALRLCYESMRKGGTHPTVLNAANEVAVLTFLRGELAFNDIVRVVEDVLSRCSVQNADNIETIRESDRWAREEARRIVEGGYRAAGARTGEASKEHNVLPLGNPSNGC